MSILGKALDTRRAQPPVPYASRRGTGGSAFGATRSAGGPLSMMGSVGTLFAIVNRTSTACAAPDWHLYRTPRDGKPVDPGDREEVYAHAAVDLWNTPNPFMTQNDLIEIGQQHIDLAGECFLVVVRAGSIPVELWPIRPDKITVVPSAVEFIAGYTYTDPDGNKIPLALDEVIHLKMPNPEDPYRGLAPVAALMVDLGASTAAAAYNAAFFRNSAEPGGVIQVDRRLGDDEFDEMTTRWNEQHRGTANAHRVAVIEQGQWVERKYTMRDMQFAELREVSRDVIMEAYGISRATLGITDGVNFAAAKAAKAQFAELLTVPRLERWRQALNHRLLPMFGTTGQGVSFDYDTPDESDEEADNAERTSRATAAQTLINAGFDRTAVLAWAGLPGELAGTDTPDPERDLLITLVTGAPSLAPLILPLLGFTLPTVEPAPAPTPSGPANAARHIHNAVDPGAPVGVDLTELATAWDQAMAAAMGQWETVRATWRADLRKQIVKIVKRGRFAELATMAVDPGDGAARLREILLGATDRAYNGVVRDATAQGVTIAPRAAAAPPPPQEEPVPPDDIAATIAALLAAQIALAAAAEAIRIATPGVTADEVATTVDTFLTARSTASERAVFGGAVTGAQNRGRRDAYAAGPVGSLYAVEKLDGNTCPPCSRINGRFICTTDDLAPYDRLYTAMGGYIDCEGGIRCRGVVTGVWRPQTTGGATP